MKKIKTFIPEIIIGVVLTALIVAFFIVTSRLNSNSVYDGNYVGGNSTEECANVDIKWISSVEDVPGVDKIEFSQEGEFKSYEEKDVLETKGWYLVDYEIKANVENGYIERKLENVLVRDGWIGKQADLYVLDVEGGVGTVSKIEEHSYTGLDGWSIYPIYCEVYPSNNGISFAMSDMDFEFSKYLEKNGTLTAYNYQIAQACIIGGIAIVGVVYFIYAFSKNKIIPMGIVLLVLLVFFVVSMTEMRDDSAGEWRHIEDDYKMVLIPRQTTEYYLQIVSYDDGLMVREAEDGYLDFRGFDTESDEFKKEYERYDIIWGYATYPLVLIVDIAAGLILGFLGLMGGKKKSDGTVTPGYNWEYPYGEYSISGIKYSSGAFVGMEEYLMQNVAGEKVKFLPTYFAFDDVEIEEPQYVDEFNKISLYEGAPREKLHRLSISGDNGVIDLDLIVTKKSIYLRKKLENAVIIVYEIQLKEG